MVSPLMRGGATLASRSPQSALVVGSCAVGSRATLTINASVPARSTRRHRYDVVLGAPSGRYC